MNSRVVIELIIQNITFPFLSWLYNHDTRGNQNNDEYPSELLVENSDIFCLGHLRAV